MSRPRHTEPDNLLNVHAFLPISYANGPGARVVVWTQGCALRCQGCCNLGTHSHAPRILIEPERLARYVSIIPGIEGLTVSGGEPFEQARAVASLCQTVRERGLSIMVFTGWTYDFIRNSVNRDVQDLLAQIDILVDGPFIQALSIGNLLWRGSSNQQIIFLTDRYGPEILRDTAQPQMEVRFAGDGPLGITGFPERVDLESLAHRLREEAGIILKPTQITSRHPD